MSAFIELRDQDSDHERLRVVQSLVAMTMGLDGRLAGLLQERKGKGRYRQLREYDTSSKSGLVDFVSPGQIQLSSSYRNSSC